MATRSTDLRPPLRDLPRSLEPTAARRRWEALLRLLDDDSATVLAAVRAEFLRGGGEARRALRRALSSGSPRVRGRARQMLVELERTRAVRRLVRAAAKPVDLESALFLLDAYGSPRLDVRPYKRALDAMGEKVRALAATRSDPDARAIALVEVLAGEMGYRGSTEDFHHPDNIYLSRSIERRQGMPLTLCALFSFVGERAGIRTSLLPFPGHVLLRLHPRPGTRGAIVDPFGGGQQLSESQCLSYLSEHRLPYRAEWFEAAPADALLERHVRNLANSCRARGRAGESRSLELVLHTLERSRRTR